MQEEGEGERKGVRLHSGAGGGGGQDWVQEEGKGRRKEGERA